jgi:transcriptional regulator with XRE-family HTH domain
MSGAELARRLKVDRATIWRWETGKQRPENLELVQAFADIFAMDLDDALAAAGMRPAEVVPRVEPPMDPDVAALLRKLEDPATPPAVKERIRTMMRALVELADSQPPRAPRRRKAG